MSSRPGNGRGGVLAARLCTTVTALGRLTLRIVGIVGDWTAYDAARDTQLVSDNHVNAEAPEVARRARAFVAHNTDRLNITPLQLFASRLAVGDKGAVAAQRAAKAAGVNLCRVQPANGMWDVGDTMAVNGVSAWW